MQFLEEYFEGNHIGEVIDGMIDVIPIEYFTRWVIHYINAYADDLMCGGYSEQEVEKQLKHIMSLCSMLDNEIERRNK